MNKALLLALFLLFCAAAAVQGQGFEVLPLQDSYRGQIGEIVKVPVRFKNTTDKTITLIIRKAGGELGSTQRAFFCFDNNCLDQKIEDYIVKVDPGQTLNTFQVALDAGLAAGESSVQYVVFNRAQPGQLLEFTLNYTVEEKAEKANIYDSRFITLHDVYPNPVSDNATVVYKILNDRVKAQLRLHNLLGNVVADYDLSPQETQLRLRVDDLSEGIYFYTLYLEGESVVTRKLIIKK